MTSRETVYDAIDQECGHQDAKYGTPAERRMPISEYVRIAYAELCEAKVSLDEGDQDAALCELMQVAAVVVQCLRFHGVVTRLDMKLIEADRS